MRVMKHRHRLPRGVIDAPPLETFKVRLARTLSNPNQLMIARRLDRMAFKVSSTQLFSIILEILKDYQSYTPPRATTKAEDQSFPLPLKNMFSQFSSCFSPNWGGVCEIPLQSLMNWLELLQRSLLAVEQNNSLSYSGDKTEICTQKVLPLLSNAANTHCS